MSNQNAEKYVDSASAPNLSSLEERELFLIIIDKNSSEEEKQEATDKICRSHVRFVSGYAHRFAKLCPMDVQDLIGAGVEGVMSAISRYDVESNNRFACYCGWWIKKKIIECIQKNYPISMPQSMRASIVKLQKAIQASSTEMSRSTLSEKLNVSEKKISEIEAANVSTFSLSSPVNIGDNNVSTSYEDILASNCASPFEELEHKDLLNRLREVLSEMDPKSVEIVMSKYSDEKVRLQDLADKYNVSPERIRQLRVEATKEVKDRLMDKRA